MVRDDYHDLTPNSVLEVLLDLADFIFQGKNKQII